MRKNRILAAGAALLMLAAAPFAAQAFDIDHKHGRYSHHGGEIGQALTPDNDHATGCAGVNRLNHRHQVIPESDHYGHSEVIQPCVSKAPAASSCSGAASSDSKSCASCAGHAGTRAPTHASAAARGDEEADARDYCDEVYVSIPTGYHGRAGYGYYDTAEMQMGYAFHHLTREDLAKNRKQLEAKGLIPAGSGFQSKNLDRLVESMR